MSWTLSTSGAALIKAGAGRNTYVSGAYLDKFSDEAEGQINGLSRYDWVANYASVGANFKPILDDAVSDIVAMKIINFDMNGYPARQAETMLDVLRDNLLRNLEILKDDKNREKMGA